MDSLLLVAVLLCSPALRTGTDSTVVRVPVSAAWQALLDDEDTDGDNRITINDCHVGGTSRGDKRFALTAADGTTYGVFGTPFLSNLLEELTLLRQAGRDTADLRFNRIYEKPATRISRSIRGRYWDNLTRTIDEPGLRRILVDEKSAGSGGCVYVPHDDSTALSCFRDIARRHPDWSVTVIPLPDSITPAYVRSLDGRHGILTLGLRRDGADLKGVPFVVPGGRFNEMYGWDSYFIVLGLLHDDRVGLARSMVDNMVYEIRHYGAILNANRTYYLTRSQPPFLTSMIRACYARLPRTPASRTWLAGALEAAIAEYSHVWTGPLHMTATGLSRYFDKGSGVPPEVEPGHFDATFAAVARQRGMDPQRLEREYRAGTLHVPELDTLFMHDRAMRESGHDTSNRLYGRCADLVTVDLNALLFKVEMDIAEIIDEEFGGRFTLSDRQVETGGTWRKKATRRRTIIDSLLWNGERGMFFDFDVAHGCQTAYESATTFYPLWAGLASREQADLLVRKALPLLEEAGGIVSATRESRGPVTAERPQRQWDYPFGWAPHQILTWVGLQRYGYEGTAQRLAYKWLFTISWNAAEYNGTVPEKFDVVRRSHRVFAEYGNVGTTFSYITPEGFGWTNASFQLGMTLLSTGQREHLNDLIPPEWMSWRDSEIEQRSAVVR